MKEKEKSFEDNINRLELIVDELDKGDKPLEELLKLYEEGILLSNVLRKILDNAEQKVIDISKNTQNENEIMA